MKTTERIFIVVALLGLLFKFYNYPGAGPLLILSLGPYAVFCMFGLFFLLVDKTDIVLEEEETFEESNLEIEQLGKKRVYTGAQIVISIFGGFAFSTVLFGLLFKLQKYPGTAPMLSLGLFFSSIIVILGFFLYLKTKDVFSKRLLTRAVILFLLCFSFYSIPTRSMIEIQYRNNPELKMLHLEVLENPDCVECSERLNNYRATN